MDRSQTDEILGNAIAGKYIMALTCEPERNAKTRKVRVILIQECMLKQLINDLNNTNDDFQAILEHPEHGYRWKLIQKIAKTYQNQARYCDRNPQWSSDIEWGKPLCTIELCTMGECNFDDQFRPILNRDTQYLLKHHYY